MAVRIRRQLEIGRGVRGFQFSVRADEKVDQEIYTRGVELESARFREGSLAKQVFDRLSLIESDKKKPKERE